jgi:carbon monoxide dehydrogenase subunit G
MHLEGHFTVTAPQADVYEFLTDPSKVSRHMPDVTDVTIDDPDHFTVTARVGVAHIKGSMVVKLEIRDRRPPVGTTVVGRGSGLASIVDMVTSFTLEPNPGTRSSDLDQSTTVHWRADVTISGKLAAFGPQGLLDRIARRNIDAFVGGIRAGLLSQSGA